MTRPTAAIEPRLDVQEQETQGRIVAISGVVLGVATVLAPSFLVFRPNRLFNGSAQSALQALGAWGWALLGLWVAVAALALVPLPGRTRGLSVGLIAGAIPILALWRSAEAAAAYTAEKGDVARVSLGLSFWILLVASYVVIYAATAWTPPGPARALISYTPLVGFAVLLLTGTLAPLAIMREYANNTEEFALQLRLHLLYVLGATAGGIVIGIPLGVFAAKRPRSEPMVFGVLNVLNVLPVLAFIGLLNPALTSLSRAVPLVSSLGIRAVGWAPVIIVLTMYAVYPIARNAQTAVLTLDDSVLDAARGVGMGRWRRGFEIELPLSAPVIIAGIRIALVQTTAGAIIAGLVGGGGLGSFVFLGASQTATDLVLMGTIPIVLLGLFLDRMALVVQRPFTRWSAPV